MRYYRCKCGDAQAWSSMGVNPCDKCSNCGSDLAESPELHREPQPHDMVPTTVQTDAGPATLHRCRWCARTQTEIDKRQ